MKKSKLRASESLGESFKIKELLTARVKMMPRGCSFFGG